jgi:hypothetical protein
MDHQRHPGQNFKLTHYPPVAILPISIALSMGFAWRFSPLGPRGISKPSWEWLTGIAGWPTPTASMHIELALFNKASNCRPNFVFAKGCYAFYDVIYRYVVAAERQHA